MAIVYFNEWNGAAGAELATSKNNTDIQFKSEDSPDVEALQTATAPLVKPNAGVYRSYEKYLRVYLESLDGAASVSNLEIFSSGSPESGLSIWAKAVANYDTPKSGGYDAAGAMAQPKASLFSYTSDAPLSLGAGPYNAEATSVGDYLVLQMEVLPSASTGETASYNLILRYDEA